MKRLGYLLLLLSIIDNQNGLRTSWYQTIKEYIKQIHTYQRQSKTKENNQSRNTIIKDKTCTKICQKGDTYKSYDTTIKKSSHILIGYLFDRIEVIWYTNKYKKKSTECAIQHGFLKIEKWNTQLSEWYKIGVATHSIRQVKTSYDNKQMKEWSYNRSHDQKKKMKELEREEETTW